MQFSAMHIALQKSFWDCFEGLTLRISHCEWQKHIALQSCIARFGELHSRIYRGWCGHWRKKATVGPSTWSVISLGHNQGFPRRGLVRCGLVQGTGYDIIPYAFMSRVGADWQVANGDPFAAYFSKPLRCRRAALWQPQQRKRERRREEEKKRRREEEKKRRREEEKKRRREEEEKRRRGEEEKRRRGEEEKREERRDKKKKKKKEKTRALSLTTLS